MAQLLSSECLERMRSVLGTYIENVARCLDLWRFLAMARTCTSRRWARCRSADRR
jgi:hypothetical protein